MNKMMIVLTIALLLISLVFVAGCVQTAEKGGAEAGPELEAAIDDATGDIVNETETIDIGNVI